MNRVLVAVAWVLFLPLLAEGALPVVTVGSKNFPESYILAEMVAQKIERAGFARVRRNFGMGGTQILYESLKAGEVDIYPEYTGTLSLLILKTTEELPFEDLRARLKDVGLHLSEPMGFNNSYGLAMRKFKANKLGIKSITDLRDHPELRMAFSYEFMRREDGYPGLVKTYRLEPKTPVRMDHSLVYSALMEDKTDVIEIYTTDSKIKKFDLVLLEDNLGYFPKYEGLFIYTEKLKEKIPEIDDLLTEFAGAVDQERMLELNSLVELEEKSFEEAAGSFFEDHEVKTESRARELWRLTRRHSVLVFVPMLISILIGVPLGIFAAKSIILGRLVLMITGIVQTTPSLALLCFLIPIFGIGLLPSMVALVLYGLLPIVRGAYSGITGIEGKYTEVAGVIGMSGLQKLFRVELPLASVHILNGIQTAAVINVGLATLAAFIGAGGYGSLIVTGLALNSNAIILRGALPAAAMAIVVHFLFELIDKILIPKGLKL